MKITSNEIKTKTFTTKLRGFDSAEVVSFLGNVSVAWEDLQKQNQELKEKLIELETKLKGYTSMEKAIHETFMQAQETSGKAVDNARKEAQLIIHEAELKATQLLEKARNDQTALKEQVTILKAKKDSIVVRLKMLLNSELDLIKALEVDEEFQLQNKTEALEGLSKDKSEIEDIIKNIE